MAEEPFYSSPGSHHDEHQVQQTQTRLDLSPQKRRDEGVLLSSGLKPQKPPTVTPRRFKKFFTPKSSLHARNGMQSKAAKQLKDITRYGANRGRIALPLHSVKLPDGENVDPGARRIKRRKFSVHLPSSLTPSSSLKYVQPASPNFVFQNLPSSPTAPGLDPVHDLFDQPLPLPQSIQRLHGQGCALRVLQRSFGGRDVLSRGQRGFHHCADWRAETANFVSLPTDVHAFRGTAVPFCISSCNTNSLIAIGDEDGGIRLIDPSPTSDFATAHVSFRPHRNAVMDVAFSSDDYQLATASGDQTARMVDMHTQQTVCVLSGHNSSVKQVRFQPCDNNLITTSSRDGTVAVWDLRCAAKGAVQDLRTSFARAATADGDVEPAVRYAKENIQVGHAHRVTKQASNALNPDEAPVSVTTIQHLSHGREHLLMTACQLNASVKLWDLRNIARKNAMPVSSTRLPESHTRTRDFGINALLLSGDGARLYAVCRDSVVYAYSTNHLMLGSAPELSSSAVRRRAPKETKLAVGPLYGISDPQFRAGSFYVKAALRQTREDKSEVIAVGSTDGSSVLFSTDERHLRPVRRAEEDDARDDLKQLPATPSTPCGIPDENVLPIYSQGTALIRAHHREVTSMAWSQGGELVTIGDDYTARCWRENAGKARELRGCGESGGQRWGCGWADVAAEWDKDDG